MPPPPRPAPHSTRAALVVALGLATVGLAACGGDDRSSAALAPAAPLRAALVDARATTPPPPRAIRGCDGVWITPGRPAARVLSLRNYVTETLVALGAGDRLVGQVNAGAFTPLPSTKAAYGRVPVLAEDAPSKEQVLAARPDLVVGDGSWAFDGKAVPTARQLVADGVAPYVIATACLDADKGEPRLDDVYATLEDLGRLTGTEPVARRLVAWGRERARRTDAALTGAAPVVYAGTFAKGELFAYDRGSYAPILRALRVENALPAGTVPKGSTFAQVSREQVLRRDPDALLVTYIDDADRRAQERQLRTSLGTLGAVRRGRVVLLPEAFFTGGLQTLQLLPATAYAARGQQAPTDLVGDGPPVATE